MSDLWSHSHDWDNGYAVGNKDGYQQGQTDLLLPYDVETIEELSEKVKSKERADIMKWFVDHDMTMATRGLHAYFAQMKEQKNE